MLDIFPRRQFSGLFCICLVAIDRFSRVFNEKTRAFPTAYYAPIGRGLSYSPHLCFSTAILNTHHSGCLWDSINNSCTIWKILWRVKPWQFQVVINLRSWWIHVYFIDSALSLINIYLCRPQICVFLLSRNTWWPSYQMKCTSSLYKTWLMTLSRESTCPGTAIVFAWTSPSIQNQIQLLLKLSLFKTWVDYAMQQHWNTPVRFNPCFSCLWCYDTIRFIFVC